VTSIPDAVPRAEPRSLRGNPPFYEVFGKRYYVLPSADGYSERGVASWYGPGFHAERTSMGEPYDMYAMTAAHKTLPLPCYARVSNLANGRSVVVRINDRGPFVGDRIIDLSYTAAAKLDMLRAGTAMVEVVVLTPGSPASVAPASLDPRPLEPQTPAPAGAATALYVQAGAFSERANAQRVVDRVKGAGIDDATVLQATRDGRALFRVRVGPVTSVAEYDALVARLAAIGVTDTRLVTD
jgi:rare lipoprotein A